MIGIDGATPPARDSVKPRDVEVSLTETKTSSVTRKRPDTSIYAKLGLMNGDVVTAIHGENTNSPSDVLKRLTELSDHFDQIRDVSILRNGKSIELSFNRN